MDTVEGTKLFVALGSSLQEESFTPQGQGGFGMTNVELDEQVREVNEQLFKMGRQHPQYASKLAQYQDLLNKRHGTAPVAESSAPRL